MEEGLERAVSQPTEAGLAEERVRWGVMEGTFGHKLGLELRVCKPLVPMRR